MTEKEREEKIKEDSQKYELEKEISELKRKLSDSDYKIIKCYEAQLQTKKKMPYNVDEEIKTREKIRDEINELEKELQELEK